MNLYAINTVAVGELPGWYIANIDCDFGYGRQSAVYYLDPKDSFGLAPQVRASVQAWINAGRAVAPTYVPEAP